MKIELARGLEMTLDTYHFTRNAISLVRLCGYPSSILDKAEENALKFSCL